MLSEDNAPKFGSLFVELWLKACVLLFAVFTAYFLALHPLQMESLSKYWFTKLQPFFIISNAATSYYFFSLHRWRIPAFFLLLLTAFSVDHYQHLHNVFAVFFFLSCIYSMSMVRRGRIFIPIYLATLPIFVWSIIGGEVAAITVIASYHAWILFLLWKIKQKRQRS